MNKRTNPMDDETLQRISKILSESVGATLYPVSASVEARTVFEVANDVCNATDVILKFSTIGGSHG